MTAPRAASPPSSRPTIPPERYRSRLERAASLAREAGVSALLIGVGADLRYLAGYTALPLERLTLLVVPAEGPPAMVVPRLEQQPALECPACVSGALDIVSWQDGEDPIVLAASIVRATGPSVDGQQRLAVSDRLIAAFLLGLQHELPDAGWSSASTIVGRLRVRKDPEEVDLLRLAAEAADRTIEAITAGPLVGRSEADIAREVRQRLVAEGHDLAEFSIVASGPGSASPHHEPSQRVVAAGEPIVLDIGGSLDGYVSDITRTVWVTGSHPALGPDEEFLRIRDLVAHAHRAAMGRVSPGVSAASIDAAAREVIEAGGYGERFIHRVGHGIGLEGHEDPYLVAGNDEPLEAGMAFSIEPGIYLEDRYGVRLEDIVVCGDGGPIVLNRAPRGLLVVEG